MNSPYNPFPARLQDAIGGLLLLITLHMITTPALHAQPMKFGPASGALADGTVALPHYAGANVNPANAAYTEKGVASLYAVQIFGLQELRLTGLQLVLPFRPSNLLLAVRHIGVHGYREFNAQAGVAVPLKFGSSRFLNVGATTNLQHISILRHGSTATLSFTLGIAAQISANTYWGVTTQNYFQPKLAPSLERSITSGIATNLWPNLWLMGAVFSAPGTPLSFRLAFNGAILPALSFQYGIKTQPLRYTLGAALHIRLFSVHLAVEQHDVLGWTPGFSINLERVRQKD